MHIFLIFPLDIHLDMVINYKNIIFAYFLHNIKNAGGDKNFPLYKYNSCMEWKNNNIW